MPYYIPVTPAGTALFYGSCARSGKTMIALTEGQAIQYLLEDAAHMPYKTWPNFKARGYSIAILDRKP